jgi:hypothetical protein
LAEKEIARELREASKFCETSCGFVIRKDFDTCKINGQCWHLQDKEINPPVKIELDYPDRTDLVSIIGENNIFSPIWYLDDGTSINKRHPW